MMKYQTQYTLLGTEKKDVGEMVDTKEKWHKHSEKDEEKLGEEYQMKKYAEEFPIGYCFNQIVEWGSFYLFRPDDWKDGITKEKIIQVIKKDSDPFQKGPVFNSHEGLCIQILYRGHGISAEDIADFMMQIKDIHLQRCRDSEFKDLSGQYYDVHGVKYFKSIYKTYTTACRLLGEEPLPYEQIVDGIQEELELCKQIKREENKLSRLRQKREDIRKPIQSAAKRKHTVSEKKLKAEAEQIVIDFAKKHSIDVSVIAKKSI